MYVDPYLLRSPHGECFIKLLNIKLITDTRVLVVSRRVFEKVAQTSDGLNKQATGFLMRERFNSSEFLELGGEKFQTPSVRFQPTRYRAVRARPRLITQATATTNGQR